jgi:hypothetical protein
MEQEQAGKGDVGERTGLWRLFGALAMIRRSIYELGANDRRHLRNILGSYETMLDNVDAFERARESDPYDDTRHYIEQCERSGTLEQQTDEQLKSEQQRRATLDRQHELEQRTAGSERRPIGRHSEVHDGVRVDYVAPMKLEESDNVPCDVFEHVPGASEGFLISQMSTDELNAALARIHIELPHLHGAKLERRIYDKLQLLRERGRREHAQETLRPVQDMSEQELRDEWGSIAGHSFQGPRLAAIEAQLKVLEDRKQANEPRAIDDADGPLPEF